MTVTLAGGDPEMTGLPLLVPVTVILNAGSADVTIPSDTLIDISAYTPTSVPAGMPHKRPLFASKLAHAGFPETEKTNCPALVKLAAGVKSYSVPTCTCDGGVPAINSGLVICASAVCVSSGGWTTETG